MAESLHNKTMIITTIMTEPYTMLKENSEALTGNDRQRILNLSTFFQQENLVRQLNERKKKVGKRQGIEGI